MPGLIDMFQARSLADNQPIGFGDALQQRSNSLVGLGMGMLQPRSLAQGAPTGSAWTDALGGYMQGAQADARTAHAQGQLKMEQARLNLAKQQANKDPEAIRQLRAAGVPQEKWADYLYPKQDALTEGKLTYREQEYPYLRDRAGNYTWPLGRPPGGPGSQTATTPGGAVPGGVPSTTGAGGAATQSGAIPPPLPGMEEELPSVQKDIRKKQLEDFSKTQLKDPQQVAAAQKSAADVLTAIDTAEKQAINKGGLLPTTGVLGGKLTQVYQPSADLAATLETIAANVSLDKLTAMRAASPTGASGLGAVTEGEHDLLKASIAAVKQSQSQEQMLANLKRVRATYDWIINRTDKNAPPPFSLRPQPTTEAGGRGAGGTTKSGVKWTVE